MSVADVENGFIWDDLDGWVEVDAEGVFGSFCELLSWQSKYIDEGGFAGSRHSDGNDANIFVVAHYIIIQLLFASLLAQFN